MASFLTNLFSNLKNLNSSFTSSTTSSTPIAPNCSDSSSVMNDTINITNNINSTTSLLKYTNEKENLCILCGCNGLSNLGQGDLVKFELNDFDLINYFSNLNHIKSEPLNVLIKSSNDLLIKKKFNSTKLKTYRLNDQLDSDRSAFELVQIGWKLDNLKLNYQFDIRQDNRLIIINVHENCLLFSNDLIINEFNSISNIEKIACESLLKKCSLCCYYGASLKCQQNECDDIYHLPCLLSLGTSYFNFDTRKIYCNNHLDKPENLKCNICNQLDKLVSLILCSTCGVYYHASCLVPKIELNSFVRLGWQCTDCKSCQSCHQSNDYKKMICCEICDKCTHIYCLKQESPISSINATTNRYKCIKCSVNIQKNKCITCNQIFTRLNLKSSLSNENQCNECEQESLNKKANCLVCGQFIHVIEQKKRIRNCSSCLKYVHVSCDKYYSSEKLENYLCLNCRDSNPNLVNPVLDKKRSVKDLLQLSRMQNLTNLTSKKEEAQQQQLQESLTKNMNIAAVSPALISASQSPEHKTPNSYVSSIATTAVVTTTNTKKPEITKKKQIAKKTNRNVKRQNSSSSSSQTNGVNNSQANSGTRTSRSSRSDSSSKRVNYNENSNDSDTNSSKKKIQEEIPDEPTIGHIKRDEEDHHAVTVIVSLNDSFTLKQDMCLNCGSFGKQGELDSQLVSCSQCGQCYHTYCAGINKVTNVMLEKGWRCLDCTVCEGCGKATDESRLLLCDDCDISYHIYCLTPPLDQVPLGNWKCKWCVKCHKCGTKQPGGKNLEWKNNYTECALCNSLSICPTCAQNYKESELILKCIYCERWSHVSCKNIINEEEAERLAFQGFSCQICLNEKEQDNTKRLEMLKINKKNIKSQSDLIEEFMTLSKRGILDEGTFLTDIGAELIKKIKIKPPSAPKRNRNTNNKISTALNSLEPDNDPHKHDKMHHDDDASLSSNEDKNEQNDDHSKLTLNEQGQSKKITQRRQVSVGLGGFYLKTRNRNTIKNDENNQSGTAINEIDSKVVKRKKKTSLEDIIPTYMQEAFFGAQMIAKSKEQNGNFSLDEEFDDISKTNSIDSQNNNKNQHHRISLDENMLKSAGQNKKNHLDIGIEDFLDGDIVSYLFNENRNLIEFNSDHDFNLHRNRSAKDPYDVKIFDDKLYEDLFHQIASETQTTSSSSSNQANSTTSTANSNNNNKKTNVDEFINDQVGQQVETTESIKLKPESFILNNNDKQEHQSLKDVLAATTSLIQDDHVLNHKEKNNQDNLNIDDLARQFKESTHKYAIEKSNQTKSNFTDQFINHQTIDNANKNEPRIIGIISGSGISEPIDLASIVFNPLNEQTKPTTVLAPNQANPQPINILNLNENFINSNFIQTNTKPSDTSTPMPTPGAVVNQIYAPPSNDLDQHSNQMNSDNDDLSNDYLTALNSASAGGSNSSKLQSQISSKSDELSKSKKNLEKFAEDEDLGDMATQAMPLFSNLNYPNLKTEISDLNERFKHVQKLWRKLDGQTKLIYVNKSRQNRYKKKSDDKVINKSKNLKSPASSDKHSDVEQFSRSATPSTLISMDDTNDEKLTKQQNILSINQTVQLATTNSTTNQQFLSQINMLKPADMISTSSNDSNNVVSFQIISNDKKEPINTVGNNNQQQQHQDLIQQGNKKNFIVNLNQPHKIIQVAPNGMQIGIMTPQQQQQPPQTQQQPPQQVQMQHPQVQQQQQQQQQHIQIQLQQQMQQQQQQQHQQQIQQQQLLQIQHQQQQQNLNNQHKNPIVVYQMQHPEQIQQLQPQPPQQQHQIQAQLQPQDHLHIQQQHQQHQQQFLQVQLQQQQQQHLQQQIQHQQQQHQIHPQQIQPQNQFKIIDASSFINTIHPTTQTNNEQHLQQQQNSNFFVQQQQPNQHQPQFQQLQKPPQAQPLQQQQQQQQPITIPSFNNDKQQQIKVFLSGNNIITDPNNQILIQQQQQHQQHQQQMQQQQQQHQAFLIRTQESLKSMNQQQAAIFKFDQQQQQSSAPQTPKNDSIIINQQQTQQFQQIKLIQDGNQTIQIQPVFAQPAQITQPSTPLAPPPPPTPLTSSLSSSTTITQSKQDEIEDHIDSIINEVASGSGTIPYITEFDDDETSSSFRDTDDFSHNLNDSIKSSYDGSMDKFYSQNSMDKSSQHSTKSTTTKRKATGSNKINKQLQAKANEMLILEKANTAATIAQLETPKEITTTTNASGFIQLRLNEDGIAFLNDNNANRFIINMTPDQANSFQINPAQTVTLAQAVAPNMGSNQLDNQQQQIQKQKPAPKKRKKKNEDNTKPAETNQLSSEPPKSIQNIITLKEIQEQQQIKINQINQLNQIYQQPNQHQQQQQPVTIQNLNQAFRINLPSNHISVVDPNSTTNYSYGEQFIIQPSQPQPQTQTLPIQTQQIENSFFKILPSSNDPNLFKANQSTTTTLMNLTQLEPKDTTSTTTTTTINISDCISAPSNSHSNQATESLEKFLQLDGTSDEFEDQLATMNTSQSQQQQQQQPPQRIISNPIQASQPTQRQAANQVQTFLKVNAPVVINHELLASYGVQLNNQQNYLTPNNLNTTTIAQPIQLSSSPINQTNDDKFKIYTKNIINSPSNQTFVNTSNSNTPSKTVLLNNTNEIKTIPVPLNTIQSVGQGITITDSSYQQQQQQQVNLLVSKQQQAQIYNNLHHPINKSNQVKVFMNVPNNTTNPTSDLSSKKANETDKVIIIQNADYLNSQSQQQDNKNVISLNNNSNNLKHVIIQDTKSNNNNNTKKDVIKNQILLAQPQQQQQQQQQLITITNDFNNPNSTVIPLPNINGDNTLLKALLQTAPKNASSNPSLNQTNLVQTDVNNTITITTTPTVITQNSSNSTTTTTSITTNTDETEIKKAKKSKSKLANTVLNATNSTLSNGKINSEHVVQYTGNSSSSMHIKNLLANSSIQNILSNQNNLNNTTTVTTNTTTAQQNKIPRKRKNNTIGSVANNIPSKLTTQQKENNNLLIANQITASPNLVLNTNNELSNEMKLIEKLKTSNQLAMSQPMPDNSQLSTNYPGKQHSSLLQRTNLIKGDFFNLELEQLDDPMNLVSKNDPQTDRKFIEFILKEKGIKSKKYNCELNQNKVLKPVFKVCTARLDKPLIEIENHIIDSSTRLKELLNDNLKPTSELLTNEDLNEDYKMKDEDKSCVDYLKKETNDFEYEQVMSPVISLPQEEAVLNLKKEDTSDQYLSETNHKSQVTLKLSKKASKNILDTMFKLSDLLQMSCPASWLLGKLISRETDNLNKQLSLNDAQFKNTNDSSLNKTSMNTIINKETPYTIQQLMNASILKICKFCESLLVDNEFIVNTNLKEDSEHQHLQQPVQTSSNEEGLIFCSEFCESLYEKSLILKNFNKKRQLETESQQAKSDMLSSSKLVVKWSHNLIKPNRSDIDVESDKNNLIEIVKPQNSQDKRVCIFCNLNGDLEDNGPSRLLTVDLGKWCHLNCALWSNEVYETMNGALVNVDQAYKRSINIECCFCHHRGASLKCFTPKCNNYYHLPCAIKDKCAFNQDKTFLCLNHSSKAFSENLLKDLSVLRNVWIQRDEIAQIQSFMSRDFDEDFDYAIRIGSLILHNIGQLLPHQLTSSNFHTRDFIYPIGYKATRFYWSYRQPHKRCRYLCCINENDGLPEFSVTIIEDGYEKETLIDKSPTDLWFRLLDKLDNLRKENDLVKIFPVYFKGEYLFGLQEPHIIRLVESLPGVETLTNYAFKFGRLQLLDMPLTINPTGCARTEPKLRTHFRKSHLLTCNTSPTPVTSGSTNAAAASSVTSSYTTTNETNDEYEDDDEYSNDNAVSYSKQFVLSKSTQYKKLRLEWKANVYLAKSQIQGLGLYAARDLEKNTMIIEYIGELIRNETANRREKLYQAQNRGIYMFRLNDDNVVDATISGGLARYINHCCDPNCVAETISLDKDEKIVIIANKRIAKGEELTYDYKFDFEDDENKISCLCGSVNCKKWMN